MRVLVYLLVLTMFATSACKPLARTADAYEENEKKERMSWKKKAFIVASVGLVLFGGHTLAKYLDRIIGIRLIQDAQLGAKLSRPMFKNFKIKHDRLPLYKLIAPDGSEHWLLGTMHTTGLSIDDLPHDSRLLKVFKETTVYLPEANHESLMSLSRLSVVQQRNKIKLMQSNFNLRQALGDEHMDKLNGEIAQIIAEIKASNVEGTEEVLQRLAKIEQMQPTHALGVLDGLSSSAAFGQPGIEIGAQLIREATCHRQKNRRFGEN